MPLRSHASTHLASITARTPPVVDSMPSCTHRSGYASPSCRTSVPPRHRTLLVRIESANPFVLTVALYRLNTTAPRYCKSTPRHYRKQELPSGPRIFLRAKIKLLRKGQFPRRCQRTLKETYIPWRLKQTAKEYGCFLGGFYEPPRKVLISLILILNS
jgi:hypothetical protein